jgi:hypothetical protein
MTKELETYYQMPLDEINALEFLVTMREMWAVHGLGSLAIDFSYRDQGFVKVSTTHSVLQEGSDIGLKPGQQPSYHLEAGFLAAWFSRWAGKELRACATDWGQKASAEQAIDLSKSMDLVSFTEFLVGSTEAIEPIERRVRQGERTSTILQ